MKEEQRNRIVASFHGQPLVMVPRSGYNTKKFVKKRRPSELHLEVLARRLKFGKGPLAPHPFQFWHETIKKKRGGRKREREEEEESEYEPPSIFLS